MREGHTNYESLDASTYLAPNFRQQLKLDSQKIQPIALLTIFCIMMIFLTSCTSQPSAKPTAETEGKKSLEAAATANTANVHLPASPTPVPTNTLTGPELDATKMAPHVESLTEQQTIEALKTSLALGTPLPALDPTNQIHADIPLGINGCGAVGPGAYELRNCWVGMPTKGEWLFASAVMSKTNGEQGALMVYSETIETGDRSPKQYYNTPTQAGPVIIANVSWPHMTLITVHPDDVTIPVVTFFFNLETMTWEEPSQCQLLPIAISEESLQGLSNYWGLHDSKYGISGTNFGWLTWDGNTVTKTLALSLAPPGDSSIYTNPDDPEDHTVSVGDWVLGRPEILGKNNQNVENALSEVTVTENMDSIKSGYLELAIPVWDQAERQGGLTRYHVSGFAWISLGQFSLAEPNAIRFAYNGLTTCPKAP